MAIGNGELMLEYFRKHLRMITARTKQGKEREEGKARDEEGKKRGLSIERSKAGTKKNKS